MVNGSGYTSGAGSYAQIILVRGATTLISLNNIYGYAVSTTGVNSSMNTAYLDSPATTSATVYKVQWRRDAGAATVYLNNTSGTAPAASTSTIVLMEIQG